MITASGASNANIMKIEMLISFHIYIYIYQTQKFSKPCRG